jgi:hypothetical protein
MHIWTTKITTNLQIANLWTPTTKTNWHCAFVSSLDQNTPSICMFIPLKGESMVFYTKHCWQKILNLKRDNFSRKHKKVYSIFTLKVDPKKLSLKRNIFSQKNKKVNSIFT